MGIKAPYPPKGPYDGVRPGGDGPADDRCVHEGSISCTR